MVPLSIRGTAHYRADIDGLRAVAVISVVLFHIDKGLLPGGFAGVDMFFVISGYLITGILFDGRRAGTFTFAEFYRRRAKRIGPALAVVILATLVVGILVMLPADLSALSQSALASMAFVANLYFEAAIDTSYFATSSDTLPLLHIWSLGVEEQFYFVWPAALMLAARYLTRRQLVAMAILVCLGSVILSQYYVQSDEMRAYYRLPSRAFELLAGATCFLLAVPGAIPQRWLREVLALTGAVAIAFSLAFVTA